MRNRSRVHTLTVAANRLEGDSANPALIKELRKMVSQLERGHTPEDDKRIERSRTLFAMLPDTRATDSLREAMLQRAYDLMWEGDTNGTDALIEFLPSAAVDKMFDAWEHDQDNKQPLSRFYAPEQK